MADLTGIALDWNSDSQLELVATSAREGSRDTVWHAQQTDPDRNEWTGWEPFGRPGGGAGAPAFLQRQDLKLELDLAVIGRDQSIWRRFQVSPGHWSDWDELGIPGGESFLGSLAFTENKDGRLEVFAARHDGTAWHRWQRSAGGVADWSPRWAPFGLPDGQLLGALAIGRDAQSRLVAFAPALVPGDEPAMWHRWQSTPSDGWSAWTSLGSPPGDRGPGEAVLGTNYDGRLEVFTVASDGAVWHRWQQRAGGPESWEGQPWHNLGAQGGGFREVAVRRDAAGCLTLAATSQNGRDLFQLTQVTPGGGWGSWSPLPSVPTEAAGPLLYLNSNGGLGLFLLTPDTGGLYQLIQREPDGSWTPGPPWPPP
jgi:hypothetical protein